MHSRSTVPQQSNTSLPVMSAEVNEIIHYYTWYINCEVLIVCGISTVFTHNSVSINTGLYSE